MEVLPSFWVRDVAKFPVVLLAPELYFEVADAAARRATQVGDTAGADNEEHDEEDQQDLQSADGYQ